MSRKAKSELTFIFKLSLLFMILLASKLNRSSDALSASEQAFAPQNNFSIIVSSFKD